MAYSDEDYIDSALRQYSANMSVDDEQMRILPGFLEYIVGLVPSGVSGGPRTSMLVAAASAFSAGYLRVMDGDYDVSRSDVPDGFPELSSGMKKALDEQQASEWMESYACEFENIVRSLCDSANCGDTMNGIPSDTHAYVETTSYLCGERYALGKNEATS